MTAGKTCYSCGRGTIQPRNLRGRTFSYRDEVGLVFDTDLTVPACDTCGEVFLNGAQGKEFSSVLERLRLDRKRSAAVRFVQTVERQFPNVPRAAWEDAFGLSRGYLSRLTSGARFADTALEILLEAFVQDPRIVIQLVQATGHMSQQLLDHLGHAGPTDRQRRLTPA